MPAEMTCMSFISEPAMVVLLCWTLRQIRRQCLARPVTMTWMLLVSEPVILVLLCPILRLQTHRLSSTLMALDFMTLVSTASQMQTQYSLTLGTWHTTMCLPVTLTGCVAMVVDYSKCAVPASPAPSWNLLEDPFGPTPVKGSQQLSPAGHCQAPTHPLFSASCCHGAQPSSKGGSPRRSLPFSYIPSSNQTLALTSAAGPLVRTSQGLALNPAFKAAPNTGKAAASHLLKHQAQTHFPASLCHASVPYNSTAMPLPHSAAFSSSGTAEPPPPPPSMRSAYDPSAVRAPGRGPGAPGRPPLPPHPLPFPPSEPEIGVKGPVASYRGHVITSSGGAAVSKKYRLPPVVPQKMASYCHVKHARGEMPNLPKDAVRSMVQVKCASRKLRLLHFGQSAAAGCQ